MHEAIPPIGLAFWRWAGASLIVLPFVWRPLCRAVAAAAAPSVAACLLLALLGVSGFNTFVYLGLQTTTATNSVLIQSTMPVQILLLNWLLFARRCQARRDLSRSCCRWLGVVVIISGWRAAAPAATATGTAVISGCLVPP